MTKLIFKKNAELTDKTKRTYNVLRGDKLSATISVLINHDKDTGYRAKSEVQIFADTGEVSEKVDFFRPVITEPGLAHRKDVKRTYLDQVWDDAEETVKVFFGSTDEDETKAEATPEKPKEKFVAIGKKADGSPPNELTPEQLAKIDADFNADGSPKKKGGVKLIKKGKNKGKPVQQAAAQVSHPM